MPGTVLMKRSRIAARALIILFLCVSAPGGARADTSEAYALGTAAVGVMLVNAGAAVTNGIALIADKPNHSNGMFGLVVGGATVGISIIGFAASNKDDSSEDFSIALGVCGIAAAVTGYLNVRAANERASGASSGRKLAVYPALKANRAGARMWGLVLEMDF